MELLIVLDHGMDLNEQKYDALSHICTSVAHKHAQRVRQAVDVVDDLIKLLLTNLLLKY